MTVSWKTSDVKTAEDLFKKELITGGSGTSDNSVRFPTALNHILGTKFKVIPGYPGSSALTLALERGETAGIGGINYSSIVANKPEWLNEKKINILLQLSLRSHPDLSGVPTILDLAKDEEQRQALELIFSQTEISRVIFGPPGMPADRLQALRSAFDKMIKDKGFLDDAMRLHIEINNPMPGEEVQDLIARLQKSKPEIVKRAAGAIHAE
ncbi:MAG: tripartite tricarboxylate transporter family receptor [Hyphomicrobiales bacterium]|nr:tripartite tricarboxylate transporter family receptor [Hyphomicrobiales bacterium]